MADAVFSFELEGSADPALEQADALEALSERIREGTAGLAGMRTAFNALKGSAHASSDAFKVLKDRIAAQKSAIANSHAEFLKLGGDFKKLKKPTQDAKTGLEQLTDGAKGAGGPLGSLVGGIEKLKGLGAGGALAAGYAAIAAAVVALGAAAVAATAALLRFGIAAADAFRSERLQLEGLSRVRNWFGLAADSASTMHGAILRVSASSALAHAEVIGLSNGLQGLGLRGFAYEEALQGIATVSSVAGQAQADMYKQMYLGARGSVAGVRAVSNDIKARFGGVARAQLLSLDVQTKKLHESFQQLFTGLQLEPFLGALHEITSMFSQNTTTGRALRGIINALFQPMIDFASGYGIYFKRFFQGLTFGALLLTLAVLKVRNWLRSTFGDTEILKGLDKQKIAVYAGAAVFGAFAAVLIAVAVGFGVLAAAAFVVLSPFIRFFAMISAGYALITSIDWGSAASALVDGFVNGITNGVTRVVGAVKRLGGAALKALKEALDIHSPSKAFARLGVELPRGMAVGVNAGASTATRAVARMADQSYDVAEYAAPPAVPAPTPSPGAVASAARRGNTINLTLTVNVDGGARDHQAAGEEIGARIADKLREMLEGVAIEIGAEAVA